MEHCINVHESMHNYVPYIYTCKLIRIWLMMCQLNVQSYCFCHVLMIFTGKKTHLSIKYNWVLWKGKNLEHHMILPWKTHRNENKFLMEIVYIFSPFEKLWNTSQSFFNIIIRMLSCWLQYKILLDFLIFSCVLISDKIERILKKKNSLISFIIYMYMYKENIFFSHRGEND